MDFAHVMVGSWPIGASHLANMQNSRYALIFSWLADSFENACQLVKFAEKEILSDQWAIPASAIKSNKTGI